MSKTIVTVTDEDNNTIIQLNLTQSEYDRAARDSDYLHQLIQNYYDETNTQEPTVETEDGPSISSNECNSQEILANSDDISGSNSLYIWSEPCIQLLLSLYEEHQEDFTKKRHKKVFEDIAKKMKAVNSQYTMSSGQCQSKLNSLKKTYKKILDHNSKSGNDRMTWPYFERMHELFGTTGWANPVATASEAGPTLTIETPNAAPTRKRKLEGIFEEFLKEKSKYMAQRMALKKESAAALIKMKQDQHKEKMEILKSICSILDNKN